MKIQGLMQKDGSTYVYELNVCLCKNKMNIYGGKISLLKITKDNVLLAYFKRGWLKVCNTDEVCEILLELIEDYN